MVLYFSGTGNSAYVAEGLGAYLNEEVVCANKLIKAGERGSFHSERPYVFVFPVYLSTIAEIFANFIRDSVFTGSDNCYFLATCASSAGSSPNAAVQICGEKGWRYMGTGKVVMPQNYIALFTMTEKEEISARLRGADARIREYGDAISQGRALDMGMTSSAEYWIVKRVERLYNGHFTKTGKFFATEGCVSCGLCVKVCPLNRIALREGKPIWSGSCIHCMACINHCPRAAIEYGKNTAGKPRYVCPKYGNLKKEV